MSRIQRLAVLIIDPAQNKKIYEKRKNMLTLKTMRIFACVLCLSSCATSLFVWEEKTYGKARGNIVDAVVMDAKVATEVVTEINDTIEKEKATETLPHYSGEESLACNIQTQIKICSEVNGCHCITK